MPWAYSICTNDVKVHSDGALFKWRLVTFSTNFFPKNCLLKTKLLFFFISPGSYVCIFCPLLLLLFSLILSQNGYYIKDWLSPWESCMGMWDSDGILTPFTGAKVRGNEVFKLSDELKGDVNYAYSGTQICIQHFRVWTAEAVGVIMSFELGSYMPLWQALVLELRRSLVWLCGRVSRNDWAASYWLTSWWDLGVCRGHNRDLDCCIDS